MPARDIEIIILDSMSTDNSREIAEGFFAKIITIPNGTFNHGLTRSLGVKYAAGELIYFTVQDACLAEEDHLKKMAAHFADSDVQSVTGIQAVPDEPDKNPAIWFKRFSLPVPEVRQFSERAFQHLSPEKQLENCHWDNVNAMYRKSALQVLPFQKTDFAEDALWAKAALSKGWKLVRDSSLVVYHYHHETFGFVFKVKFMLNYTIWKHFKIMPPVPLSLKPFFQNVYTLLKSPRIPFIKKCKWIVHNAFRYTAHCVSVIIFRLAYFIGKQQVLNKTYALFCSSVPQGAQNTNGNTISKALSVNKV